MAERPYLGHAGEETGTRVSVPAGSLAMLLDMGNTYLRLLNCAVPLLHYADNYDILLLVYQEEETMPAPPGKRHLNMLLDAELVRAVDHLRVDLRLSRPAMLEVLLRWALDAEANGSQAVVEEAEDQGAPHDAVR